VSGRRRTLELFLRETGMTKKTDEKRAIDVSRRNILLAGTTMAAASALAASAPVQTAQAEHPLHHGR
jgi:hypothetical protein